MLSKVSKQDKCLVNTRLKKLVNYFRKEGALPVENSLLGDGVAEWAHNTWAYQTWSGMTREEVKAYSEDIHYRRAFSAEFAKDGKEMLGGLKDDPYAAVITDLLEQVIDEGKAPLFVYCLGRELIRKEKEILVYQSFLNFIVNKSDVYGTLKQIRNVPDEPTAETEAVWAELDNLREKPQLQSLQILSEGTEVDPQTHPLLPPHDDNAVEWRNEPESNRTFESTPTSELRAKRFVSKMWLKLEEKVDWEVMRLTQDARAVTVPKDELWERQNRIELAIRNVSVDNPTHPDLVSYREYVQHYRPLLRTNMAYLISNYSRLAQMVCEVIEIMMIRQVEAFGFLVASVNLVQLREDEQPVRDILNDMMHPEPKIYTRPRDILRRLHEAGIYIPQHLGKPFVEPVPVKSLQEYTDTNTTQLAVMHPTHRLQAC